MTVDGVNRAEIIYGTPVTIINGDMTNIRTPYNNTSIINLKLPIATHYHKIMVYMELLYAKKLPLFHTKYNKYQFLDNVVHQLHTKAKNNQ